MSNLEPVCKAIVVNSVVVSNIGKILTVGNFLGKLPSFPQNDLWEVDTELQFKNGEKFFLCSGSRLQRIDDHNTEKFFESTEQVKKYIETREL